jgi:hypothetical protein
LKVWINKFGTCGNNTMKWYLIQGCKRIYELGNDYFLK